MAQKQDIAEKASLDLVTAIFDEIRSLKTTVEKQTNSIAEIQKQISDLQTSIDNLSNKKEEDDRTDKHHAYS